MPRRQPMVSQKQLQAASVGRSVSGKHSSDAAQHVISNNRFTSCAACASKTRPPSTAGRSASYWPRLFSAQTCGPLASSGPPARRVRGFGSFSGVAVLQGRPSTFPARLLGAGCVASAAGRHAIRKNTRYLTVFTCTPPRSDI